VVYNKATVVGIILNTSEINDIRRFYETEKNALFSWALILIGNRETAEDIVHDVFVKLLRQERLPREIRPYVFQAIRNTSINHKKRKILTEDTALPLEIRITGNNGHVGSLEARLTIEEFLGLVDAIEQECLTLKECAGWTFKEIAAFQQRPINTVISCHRRALDKLRKALEATNE
jgi:RNA polymerase sigma factor (sigma-70 family)